MDNAVNIFKEIRIESLERRSTSQRCTEAELNEKLSMYLNVTRSLDLAFKELRKPVLTQEEIDVLGKIIKGVELNWRKARLSITMKAHILFKHSMDQVRRLGGGADLVEHFVEKSHQEGKRDEDRTKRMIGFRAQEEAQIKFQWGASNPSVQETKEHVKKATQRNARGPLKRQLTSIEGVSRK